MKNQDGMKVIARREGNICIVTINRPEARNAVDRETAQLLYDAFTEFDHDDSLSVAILHGEGGNFCAGADLKAIAGGNQNRLEPDGSGPMGPSRMFLSKPVIAAVSGYAVAGGLELALWCDMRVAEQSAVFGVFCRRFGVPLIDGGTIRLARIVGTGRALDMILTGRAVGADEALQMGLANRVAADGDGLREAIILAEQISRFPQGCLRSDRLSFYQALDLPMDEALKNEFAHGMKVITSGETVSGATSFKGGTGRHGKF
ncbi:MAG: crotonase/enoyl-CoA hydratase family protein [Syntrophales bacterium]|nr:crotonase/enoyl-CoA hydratase family protein [Syntrophales bacterium]